MANRIALPSFPVSDLVDRERYNEEDYCGVPHPIKIWADANPDRNTISSEELVDVYQMEAVRMIAAEVSLNKYPEDAVAAEMAAICKLYDAVGLIPDECAGSNATTKSRPHPREWSHLLRDWVYESDGIHKQETFRELAIESTAHDWIDEYNRLYDAYLSTRLAALKEWATNR